jgi:hypothetical protein
MVAVASSGPSLRQLWMKYTSIFYSVVPYANITDDKVSRKNNKDENVYSFTADFSF